MKKFLISIVLFIPFAVFASGIQVSPPKLELSGEIGREIRSEIVAANPTSDVQVFEVYPDNFPETITAIPKSFTLEAGERKEVKIIIRPQKEGIIETDLSVVSAPLADSRFQAKTGVKIPLAISITKPEQKTYIFSAKSLVTISVAMAIVFVTLVIRVWHLMKKPKSQRGTINVKTFHSPPLSPSASALPPAESQSPSAPDHHNSHNDGRKTNNI